MTEESHSLLEELLGTDAIIEDDWQIDQPAADMRIDEDLLGILQKSLGDEFESLIVQYKTDSDRFLNEIRGARMTGEDADLRRAAHSLKSASSSIGAITLADLLRSVESLARDYKGREADPLIKQIEEEYKHVLAYLGSKVG